MRRHQGPYFSSMEMEMTREEILTLYHHVHPHYRTPTFWTNFSKLCMKRGWVSRPGEVRGVLNSFVPEQTDKQSICQGKDKHRFCTSLEGVVEPIANWRMEPPMIFMGRGDHPLRGSLKRRIVPEDVILNLPEGGPVPKLPRGRKWADVIHRKECEWLWSWTDPLLKKIKYVYPSAVSLSHAGREESKFEDAMNLGDHIKNIRNFYNKSLERGEYLELSCILYLIDHLGIRIGNEQNLQTEGATTLRVRGVTVLEERKRIRVQFRGKDCIEYDNQISCSRAFLEAIRELKRGRSGDDYLFPNVTPKIVNEYLQSHHPALTAKTFRTYNASMKMKENLEGFRGGRDNPVEFFRKCATEVAVFCNHKKISSIRRAREQYSPATTITNYIDPRIVVQWAEKHSIPIDKLYPKTLRERFSWAIHNSKEIPDGE
jgi:DNA topoisomerase IB